jgi:hypothetical protein
MYNFYLFHVKSLNVSLVFLGDNELPSLNSSFTLLFGPTGSYLAQRKCVTILDPEVAIGCCFTSRFYIMGITIIYELAKD